jgi:hypothetical protein
MTPTFGAARVAASWYWVWISQVDDTRTDHAMRSHVGSGRARGSEGTTVGVRHRRSMVARLLARVPWRGGVRASLALVCFAACDGDKPQARRVSHLNESFPSVASASSLGTARAAGSVMTSANRPSAIAPRQPGRVAHELSWKSLHGAFIGVPRGWRDESSHSFALPERKGHYLSLQLLESDGRSPQDSVVSQDLTQGSPRRRSNIPTSTVEKVRTLVGAAYLSSTPLGPDAASPMVAMAHLSRGAHVLQVEFRGLLSDLEPLRAALGSFTPWQAGQPLPSGHYDGPGLSFRWSGELLASGYFHFVAPDRSGDIRLQWLTVRPAFQPPDWGRAFEITQDQTLDAPAEFDRQVRSGRLVPPFRATAPEADWEARIIQARLNGKPTVWLLYARAALPVSGRFLSVEYYGRGAEQRSQDVFRQLLESIHLGTPEMAP